jgi:hypothetical protein
MPPIKPLPEAFNSLTGLLRPALLLGSQAVMQKERPGPLTTFPRPQGQWPPTPTLEAAPLGIKDYRPALI